MEDQTTWIYRLSDAAEEFTYCPPLLKNMNRMIVFDDDLRILDPFRALQDVTPLHTNINKPSDVLNLKYRREFKEVLQQLREHQYVTDDDLSLYRAILLPTMKEVRKHSRRVFVFVDAKALDHKEVFEQGYEMVLLDEEVRVCFDFMRKQAISYNVSCFASIQQLMSIKYKKMDPNYASLLDFVNHISAFEDSIIFDGEEDTLGDDMEDETIKKVFEKKSNTRFPEVTQVVLNQLFGVDKLACLQIAELLKHISAILNHHSSDTARSEASVMGLPLETTMYRGTLSDVEHLGLGILGLTPIIGNFMDGLDTALYLQENDKYGATISALSAMPAAGQALGIAKVVKTWKNLTKRNPSKLRRALGNKAPEPPVPAKRGKAGEGAPDKPLETPPKTKPPPEPPKTKPPLEPNPPGRSRWQKSQVAIRKGFTKFGNVMRRVLTGLLKLLYVLLEKLINAFILWLVAKFIQLTYVSFDVVVHKTCTSVWKAQDAFVITCQQIWQDHCKHVIINQKAVSNWHMLKYDVFLRDVIKIDYMKQQKFVKKYRAHSDTKLAYFKNSFFIENFSAEQWQMIFSDVVRRLDKNSKLQNVEVGYQLSESHPSLLVLQRFFQAITSRSKQKSLMFTYYSNKMIKEEIFHITFFARSRKVVCTINNNTIEVVNDFFKWLKDNNHLVLLDRAVENAFKKGADMYSDKSTFEKFMKWVHDHNPAVHYCYCQLIPHFQLDGVEAAVKSMVENESDVQRGGFGCDNFIIAKGVDPDETFKGSDAAIAKDSTDVTNREVIIRIFHTCRLHQLKNPTYNNANILKVALQQGFCAPKTNYVVLFEYAHFLFDMVRYMITQETRPERTRFEFPKDSNWFECKYSELNLPFLDDKKISRVYSLCTEINKKRVDLSFMKWIQSTLSDAGSKFAEFLIEYLEETYMTRSWQEDLGLTWPNALKKIRESGLEEVLNVRFGFDIKRFGFDLTIPEIHIGNVRLAPEHNILIGEGAPQSDVPNGDKSAALLTIVYTSSLYMLMVGVDFYISSHLERLFSIEPNKIRRVDVRDCEDIPRKKWRECKKRKDCTYDKGVNGKGCIHAVLT